MKLSIVTPVYDKNIKYIPDLLKSIKDRMKCDYNFILVDNREDYKDDEYLNNLKKYMSDNLIEHQLIINPKNYAQLCAKKQALEYAYDYVWCVDGDDDIICDITQEMLDSVKGDVVVFDFEKESDDVSDKRFSITENKLLTKSDFEKYDYWLWNIPCWNKWIKKSLLDVALRNVQIGKPVSCGEDNFISLALAKYADSVEERTEVIYRYNNSRGLSDTGLKNISDFKLLVRGFDETLRLIRKDNLCSDSTFKYGIMCWLLNLIARSDCGFYKECLEIVNTMFDERVVIAEIKSRAIFHKDMSYIKLLNYYNR